MKDVNGITLNIGDTVVFIASTKQSPYLFRIRSEK